MTENAYDQMVESFGYQRVFAAMLNGRANSLIPHCPDDVLVVLFKKSLEYAAEQNSVTRELLFLEVRARGVEVLLKVFRILMIYRELSVQDCETVLSWVKSAETTEELISRTEQVFLRPSNYYIDGEDRETVPSKVDCKQKLVVELCDEVFAYLIDQLTVEQLIAVVHKGALRCADCEWKYQHHEVIAGRVNRYLIEYLFAHDAQKGDERTPLAVWLDLVDGRSLRYIPQMTTCHPCKVTTNLRYDWDRDRIVLHLLSYPELTKDVCLNWYRIGRTINPDMMKQIIPAYLDRFADLTFADLDFLMDKSSRDPALMEALAQRMVQLKPSFVQVLKVLEKSDCDHVEDVRNYRAILLEYALECGLQNATWPQALMLYMRAGGGTEEKDLRQAVEFERMALDQLKQHPKFDWSAGSYLGSRGVMNGFIRHDCLFVHERCLRDLRSCEGDHLRFVQMTADYTACFDEALGFGEHPEHKAFLVRLEATLQTADEVRKFIERAYDPDEEGVSMNSKYSKTAHYTWLMMRYLNLSNDLVMSERLLRQLRLNQHQFASEIKMKLWQISNAAFESKLAELAKCEPVPAPVV